VARKDTVKGPAQLARDVAHDLKNALNPIGLYLQLVGRAASRGQTDEVVSHLKVIERLLARTVSTIDRLCPHSVLGSLSAAPSSRDGVSLPDEVPVGRQPRADDAPGFRLDTAASCWPAPCTVGGSCKLAKC
jgi:light-regulated signal transduction histidine kinase (bacteriophytochrome)